jgi:hypothetical protein
VHFCKRVMLTDVRSAGSELRAKSRRLTFTRGATLGTVFEMVVFIGEKKDAVKFRAAGGLMGFALSFRESVAFIHCASSGTESE